MHPPPTHATSCSHDRAVQPTRADESNRKKRATRSSLLMGCRNTGRTCATTNLQARRCFNTGKTHSHKSGACASNRPRRASQETLVPQKFSPTECFRASEACSARGTVCTSTPYLWMTPCTHNYLVLGCITSPMPMRSNNSLNAHAPTLSIKRSSSKSSRIAFCTPSSRIARHVPEVWKPMARPLHCDGSPCKTSGSSHPHPSRRLRICARVPRLSSRISQHPFRVRCQVPNNSTR